MFLNKALLFLAKGHGWQYKQNVAYFDSLIDNIFIFFKKKKTLIDLNCILIPFIFNSKKNMFNQKIKKRRSSIINQLFLGHGQRNVYLMEWRILNISISVAEWYSNLSTPFISPKKKNLKSFSQLMTFQAKNSPNLCLFVNGDAEARNIQQYKTPLREYYRGIRLRMCQCSTTAVFIKHLKKQKKKPRGVGDFRYQANRICTHKISKKKKF